MDIEKIEELCRNFYPIDDLGFGVIIRGFLELDERKNAERLSEEFGIIRGVKTIKGWSAGTGLPHPKMRPMIIRKILEWLEEEDELEWLEEEDEDDGE